MNQPSSMRGQEFEAAHVASGGTIARARDCARSVRWRLLATAALAVLVLQACVAQAQLTGLPVPRLQSVSPGTAQPGSSLEVTLNGQDLDEPDGLMLSHAGVKAEAVARKLPPPDKKGAKGAVPPLTYKLQIPPNMPAGWLDVRLVNKWGVSNPVALHVSETPEVAEREPNGEVDQAQRVDLNVAVNGAITVKTDVDYFVFSGGKGQTVVITCLTASRGSPLDVAVELFNAAGKELGFSHHYRGAEAVLSYRLPSDGDYVVRVHSFGYLTGAANQTYQMTVSTGPWIDAVFPPVVEPGRKTKVTVFGRNLPGGRVDPAETVHGCPVEKVEAIVSPAPSLSLSAGPVNLPAAVFMPADQEWIEYTVRNTTGQSNPYVLGLAKAPVVLDNGDNDSPAKAQAISLPCEIAGRIEKRRDRDWYTFTAKKGETWDVDVLGDRIGSPLDLFFVLRDARTEKVLTQLDDKAPSLDPPRFRFVAPDDGAYQLLIGSHASDAQFGPQHLYRVSMRREQPGFKLQAVNQPGAGIVPRGGSNSIPLLVTRFGDWNGEIRLAAENLPAGVVCPPQIVGSGIKQALLVFNAAPDAQTWTGDISIKGTAIIAGKSVTQLAHGVSSGAGYARSNVLAVRDSAPFSLTAQADKVVLSQGDKLTLKLAASQHWPGLNAPVQVSALSLPAGITLSGKYPALTFADKGAHGEATLVCKADMQPGTYTLLLQGQAPVAFTRTPGAKAVNLAIKLSSAPITVTVLPTKVATLTIVPTAPALKIGKETELLVKVKRLYDYDGAFRLQLAIPDSVKGLAAAEAVIPAGADQAKLVLKADPNATAGPRSGLLLRVIAVLPNDLVLTHELKLAVNVVK